MAVAPIRCRPWVAALMVLMLSANAAHGYAESLPLKPVSDVPLSGGTTRLDYESLDPRDGRLFIAHLGDSMVTVFDIGAGKVLQDIHGVGHVHGVLVVPELERVYASATQTDEVVVIDEQQPGRSPPAFRVAAIRTAWPTHRFSTSSTSPTRPAPRRRSSIPPPIRASRPCGSEAKPATRGMTRCPVISSSTSRVATVAWWR